MDPDAFKVSAMPHHFERIVKSGEIYIAVSTNRDSDAHQPRAPKAAGFSPRYVKNGTCNFDFATSAGHSV
jgi:hypothetical protein